ncbi:FAD binding domain protein [Apiospora hydei]|uniref:FAD binding domain protein n=1 Tax=Apiospora hydei TaxID=1337664 RepID=A0ABR1VGM5_9PEZI
MHLLLQLSLAASALASAIPAKRLSVANSTIGPYVAPGTEYLSLPDPEFPIKFTQRHSSFANPGYISAVQPLNVQDLSTMVKSFNKKNLRYMATGGGHGISTGFARVQNAIDIDLSKFNTIDLDVEKNLVTVGAANVLADFADSYTGPERKSVTTGNSPCVSAIGATLGAGVGPMQGLHGLMIDSLRSVEMVTPGGDVVTASQTENTDLFWAVRGAGAHFGIVTRATYAVYDATNRGEHVNADFRFDSDAQLGLLNLLKDWDSDEVFPREMAVSVTFSYDHVAKMPTISVSAYYFGSYEAARPYLQKLVDLKPIHWRNETLGWNGMTQAAGFGQTFAKACVRGRYTTHFSAGIRQTDPDTWASVLAKFTDWSAARPWFKGSIILQRYNAKVTQQVPAEDRGAYPGEILGRWSTYDGPNHDVEVREFYQPLRDAIYRTSGFASPQVYVNYAHGDESPEAWYGPSLSRLRLLKQKYDPQNRFGPGFPVSGKPYIIRGQPY